MLSIILTYSFSRISRCFRGTYNVPRSKYSVHDRAAESSYHSKTDEDNRRHQLWRENRGASASSVFTSRQSLNLSSKCFHGAVVVGWAVGRVRTAVTGRHACHLAPAVHDWHTAQLFISTATLNSLICPNLLVYLLCERQCVFNYIQTQPVCSHCDSHEEGQIPEISTQQLNVIICISLHLYRKHHKSQCF